MAMTPTLDVLEAAAHRWDALVVGAGCAGTMAARELARRGLEVLLVDKASFPRNKVCGCCLNRRAMEALERAGIDNILASQGAVPLNELRIAADGRVASIPLPRHAALSRERLDSALVTEGIQAGVHFLPDHRVTMESASDTHRTVLVTRQGLSSKIEARLVVAADGLGGQLFKHSDAIQSQTKSDARIGAGAMYAEAPAYYESERVYMACGTGGYVGLVRIEDGRLDVAAAFDSEYVKACGGLANAANRILETAGFPVLPADGAVWKGTPALTRRSTALSAHRALIVGDAAGYVEPFTGEGMAWALTSGYAIAPIAAACVREFSPQTAAAWDTLHRRIVRRRQASCKAVAFAMRRPRFIAGILPMLRCAPAVVTPFLRAMNAPLQGEWSPRP